MRMKPIVIVKMVILVGLQTYMQVGNAQAPNWQVQPSKYAYNMVVVGLVKIDGVEATNTKDMVAAFINGEVRGVAQPVLQTQTNNYIFYLLVYSNDDGATISIQYYDATKNTTSTLVQTMTFTSDALIGNQDTPYVWANRVTRTEAKLLSYSVTGQFNSRINSDSLIVHIPSDLDRSSLVSNFVVSDGASLYISKAKQTSGVTVNDFRNSTNVSVHSEDEQTINNYYLKFIDGEEIIPNALFPNGLQRNRTWGISHFGDIGLVSIKVFNNTGQVVFSSTSSLLEWDGSYNGNKVPGGLYFYKIDIEGGERKQGTILVVY